MDHEYSRTVERLEILEAPKGSFDIITSSIAIFYFRVILKRLRGFGASKISKRSTVLEYPWSMLRV